MFELEKIIVRILRKGPLSFLELCLELWTVPEDRLLDYITDLHDKGLIRYDGKKWSLINDCS